MPAVRLDKFLAQSGDRTRSEAVKAVRAGQVRVNGVPVRDPSAKIGDGDTVTLAGEIVGDDALQYYLLYKPSGVVTASHDSRSTTVMDLLPPKLKHRKVLPVGRLDKDTTGLLLFTNDGVLAHSLIDPKRHVWKRYIARVEGKLTQSDIDAFAKGIPLKDFTAKPAVLRILESGEETSLGETEVCEGKFHQVKRMFGARGHEVLSLHRAQFGPLTIPEGMQEGDYVKLTQEQVQLLRDAVNPASEE